MSLRNKKTGEIGWLYCDQTGVSKEMVVFSEENNFLAGPHWEYDSLAELNEEWEDMPEEPKGYWYIDCAAPYPVDFCKFNEDTEYDKEIGNYFETREEAEKAVEKLKAWKRLKDGGITFKNWTINQTGTIDCFATWGDNIPPSRKDPTLQDDLDLLFSGDEE